MLKVYRLQRRASIAVSGPLNVAEHKLISNHIEQESISTFFTECSQCADQ